MASDGASCRRRTGRSAVHFGCACGQREAKAPQTGMFIGLDGSKMEGAPRRVDKREPSRGLRNGPTPSSQVDTEWRAIQNKTDGVNAPRRHRDVPRWWVLQPPRERERPGVRLARSVWIWPRTYFKCTGADASGAIVFRRKLRRHDVLGFFARQPRCVVAMEACGGAHYWGRRSVSLAMR